MAAALEEETTEVKLGVVRVAQRTQVESVVVREVREKPVMPEVVRGETKHCRI